MTRSPAPTNMVAFDGRSSRPKTGDVNVVRVGDVWCPARVVSTEAKVGSMSAVLGYVFEPVTQGWDDADDSAAVQVSRLLVEPFLVNQKPWTMRFFRRVGQREFREGELLEQHCFRATNGQLFDEFSEPMSAPVEPVGFRGLQSYRTLDDRLSDALGIARVPDDA